MSATNLPKRKGLNGKCKRVGGAHGASQSIDNDMDNGNNSTAGGGGDPEYLTIALIVGVPCGVIIVVLACLIVLMCCLVLKSSSVDNGEQVEAMYMRKRFQGLSLEDQRRMKQKRKKKFLHRRSSAETSTRRSSAAVESQVQRSTSRISARALPQANLFGLQEWQLRMAGIEAGDPETEETDADGEDIFYRRRPMGAINPLLAAEDEESQPGYDIPRGHRHAPNRPESSEGSSDDSMNPYDEY